MATSSREDRRRRIVERGSDRLALITGQIQTLPSSSSTSSSPTQQQSHHSHTVSSPASFFENKDPQTYISDQINVGPEGENAASGTLLKCDIRDEFLRGDAFDVKNRVEPQLRKCETSIEAKRAPALEVRNNIQSSLATAIVPEASVDTEPLSKPHGSYPNFFTAKQINYCIIASESIRIFCSVIIALLVVLSHISHPLGSNIVKSKSIIASRPLYILLLTEVTIVVAQLLLEKRRGSEKAEKEERMLPPEDGNNWAGAVKVLEMGLVLYQTIRAVFVDFSFYAVVVICGLSLT